ncbi:efflux transporter periplasmic adaptor subunit [Acuticoccus sediminis]|uniref:Efflux transporter periplasmic adaptor subunit n=1 Tax=Acuticoccus sediminis TaxID=2184697 RepID=A0A8B2P218_9HYPH|nr:efflux transporter periplasmic adaptor subunit [Acuticoccus sediminis]
MRLAAQAILPAVILFAAWAWTDRLVDGGAADHAARTRPAETVYSVTAVDAEIATNRATLRAFGEVVALESAELRVASPGRVVEVHPDLAVGGMVDEGATLVRIDPFAYSGALREARAQLKEAEAAAREAESRIAMGRSDLARAEEQLTLATRDLDRATTLRSGTITDRAVDERRLLVSQRQQSVDQARYSLEGEEARLDQQRAQIDRLEWTVEEAERALEDTVLAAPFRGIVLNETAALGRIFQANDVAVTLVRADGLEVRFVLSDERYGRLIAGKSLIGAKIAVAWLIGDEPLTYTAVVNRIGAKVASDTGGVDVYARLELPPGALPRPGAFVEVAVPDRPHPQSARVPTTALYGDHVFVIGDDDRLERIPVTVLARDGSEAIVRGPLKPGDQIVTTRLAEAGDGLKVRRVDLDDTGEARREPS